MSMVETVVGTTPKQILVAPELAFSLPVQVTNTEVEAGADGRKVIKAGSAIGGATDVLQNRNTVLTIANASGKASVAQGILLHDVDVTDGKANGTILISGYVDVLKIETESVPSTEVQKALSRIVFMKGV